MGWLRRLGLTVVGGGLVAIGIVLLVLPGPGLLVVLAGLAVLSLEYPSVRRYLEPVRLRATAAAEESVRTPLRLAGSVVGGLALVAAGAIWIWDPGVPLGGIGTGTGLIVSGVIVEVLVGYSVRQVRRRARVEADGRAVRESAP